MNDEKIEGNITKRGGSRPNTGGKRPNSGRKKGTPNKVSLEIKAVAQQYGEQAIHLLANLMITSDSHQAQIAAAKELLDRGYGKATQATEISGKDGEPLGYTFEVVRVGSKNQA